MSAATVPAAPPPARPRRAAVEHRVVLSGIRWQTYEALLADLKERRLRLTYDRGELEIMAPSFNHERCKRQLGRLIETLAEEFNRTIVAGGSTTFRREDLERGLEPDDCFYLTNVAAVLGRTEIDLRRDPPPDLALEIDITSSSVNRIDVYAALGVPELWRFDGATLRVYRLGDDQQYGQVSSSPTFLAIALSQVEEFLRRHAGTDDGTLVRSFRGWVRSVLAAGGEETPPAASSPT